MRRRDRGGWTIRYLTTHAMSVIDTNTIEPWERLPGWRGRTFDSPSTRAIHEQEEVWHVVSGELEVTIAGQSARAGPGVVAIVPGGTPHSVRALSDGMAIVVDHPLRADEHPSTR